MKYSSIWKTFPIFLRHFLDYPGLVLMMPPPTRVISWPVSGWCQYNGAQHDPPKYVNHHWHQGRQGPQTANQKTQSGQRSNHKPMKISVPVFLDFWTMIKIWIIFSIPCCIKLEKLIKFHAVHPQRSICLFPKTIHNSAPFNNFWLTYSIPLLQSMKWTNNLIKYF